MESVSGPEFECDTSGMYIAYFGAKWCGPCKILKPKIEKLAVSLAKSGIKVYDIDIDTVTSHGFDISYVPSVFVVSNGVSELIPSGPGILLAILKAIERIECV